MTRTKLFSPQTIPYDVIAGSVVFLVALPLCLGVAFASTAPLFSGVLAGIIGGIVVAIISRSHTSVSGPSAGLTAVFAAQIAALGSFESFLLAVVVAGMIQLALGLLKAGRVSAFFPSSVVRGLLAAIGLLLILKQIPHVLGHDADPEGEMQFMQPDHQNTFSELARLVGRIHPGAATIGLLSFAMLIFWDRIRFIKKSAVLAPLVVVVLGVVLGTTFESFGSGWAIGKSHLVDLPPVAGLADFYSYVRLPDFSQWNNPTVYSAGLTIAMVASLETLLNLQAADKVDPQQRRSPPSRELVAQGIGNVLSGMIGGLPVTSVMIRSSVNINAGGRTKLSPIIHGLLLLVFVSFFSAWLNRIPLACLAAILLATGTKLFNFALVRQVWNEGRLQFVPFVMTVVAIVLTDLATGTAIGLAVSVAFILHSNFQRPLRRILEKHMGGEVLRVELANQVSFLNRAALEQAFDEIPSGRHVLIDARYTVYIDPDILSMIREFKDKTGPIRGIQVSLRGFADKFPLPDDIQYVEHSTRELQRQLTAEEVLQILKDGNDRFRTGHRLTRDLDRQIQATSSGQHPLAVVLSCIDSRSPAELIFDLGLGDIFSARIAGNIISPGILGSMEYACAVAGAKLILVLGHTQCGAVTAAVNLVCSEKTPEEATGCQNLGHIVEEIQQSVDEPFCRTLQRAGDIERQSHVNAVSRRNVMHSVEQILRQSQTICELQNQGRVAVIGAMYDIVTGEIEFLNSEDAYASSGEQNGQVSGL